MDAAFYVEILQKHIPEVYQMMGNKWRLQQDNDPKHTSRLAKSFLQENVPKVIDWPSNSPDLNPIEKLWAKVKAWLRRVAARSVDGLIQAVGEAPLAVEAHEFQAYFRSCGYATLEC